jgi:hypothetical protein
MLVDARKFHRYLRDMEFITAKIGKPYEDMRKAPGRDGSRDWLVTIMADNRVSNVRFTNRADADAFRDPDRDTNDIVNEAFGA